MTTDEVTTLAISFPEVTESPHFEKTSFRVRKKIFATLHVQKLELVVKLSLIDQSVFCDMLPDHVAPVIGGWGRKGWTRVQIEGIEEESLKDLLTTAYKEVAPASLHNHL